MCCWSAVRCCFAVTPISGCDGDGKVEDLIGGKEKVDSGKLRGGGMAFPFELQIFIRHTK